MSAAMTLALIGVAAVLSAAGVGAMREWSMRRGILDVPNERSSHDVPVPRGGGLPMVIVALAGLAAIAVRLSSGLPAAAAIFGAALVAGVGLLDDIRSLPVPIRLAAQALAAALVAGAGVARSAALPAVGAVALGTAAVAVAFLLLVGLTNAYNFMDGIDGIAGSQAVVAGLGWLVAGELLNCRLVGLSGAVIAGAALGFLVHNWSPARVFMGDVGSGALGFLFAWLAVRGGVCDPRLPLAGLVFLWPFLFDTAFTLLRRLARGEDVLKAHRSHLYQRLVISGLSHAAVSSAYAGLSLLGASAALAWLAGWRHAGPVLVTAVPLAAAALCATVLARERRAPPEGRDGRV